MSGEANSKLTEPRIEAVLIALEHGCTRRAAAGAAGIHHSTLYEWMAHDPTLTDMIERAEGKAEAAFTAAVVSAVPRSWQAAAWWLERRRHEDYSQRAKLELTVDINAEARKLAKDLGLDEETALEEVNAILAGR